MGMLFRKRKQTKASIELTAPVLYLGGPVFGSQPGWRLSWLSSFSGFQYLS